jgi:predicted dehydrogenase
MRVSIIGCGLIGRKRAMALDGGSIVVACCDTNRETAQRFSRDFSCGAFTDYRSLFSQAPSDIVIVSVVNKFARNIIIDALKSRNHVLAEKPLGRNAVEAAEIVKTLRVTNPVSSVTSPVLKVGFNHRFHPAVWKAKEICDGGSIGKILTIRARYGHGGRPGMEKEWRASKDLCGGGELLDQGVHVIDLIRWFAGEINEVYGRVETSFWPMEVEDNAFGIVRTESEVTASFHVSWTNWKNIFSFEVFGTEGYLRIEGLGGSYGPETLEFGRRRKEGGVPDIERYEFPVEDVSWKLEWEDFLSAIEDKRRPVGDGMDGLRANKVIEAVYRSSAEERVVKIAIGEDATTFALPHHRGSEREIGPRNGKWE